MATYTPKKLIKPTQLVTLAEIILYTVPDAASVIVKELVFVNTSAVLVHFGLSIVDKDGIAGVPNRFFPDQDLPIGSTSILDLALVMESGDFISARAGTISSINVFGAGVVIT